MEIKYIFGIIALFLILATLFSPDNTDLWKKFLVFGGIFGILYLFKS